MDEVRVTCGVCCALVLWGDPHVWGLLGRRCVCEWWGVSPVLLCVVGVWACARLQVCVVQALPVPLGPAGVRWDTCVGIGEVVYLCGYVLVMCCV